MREKVIFQVNDKKVIAIVRGVYGTDCEYLVEALLEGGICLIEFTFDQNNPGDWNRTCKNIRMVCEKYQDRMICGAGTVLTVEQVILAKQAGAQFIVSPNTCHDVIEKTVQLDMVSMPGAMTPSEVVEAAEYGADFVKIFPTAQLGSAYIKALCGPLNHIPLLAVGGVNEHNVGEFIEAGARGVGIGGNLVNKKWIASGEFEKIVEIARMVIKNCDEEAKR